MTVVIHILQTKINGSTDLLGFFFHLTAGFVSVLLIIEIASGVFPSK